MALETGNAKVMVSTITKIETPLVALGVTQPKAVGLVQEYAEKQQAAYNKQMAHQALLIKNANKITLMVNKTKKYAGHTWYVRSGASPSGWDCSGLVRWAYARIGVDLYHSASVQKHSGKIVKKPKMGDIVAFGWKGWSGAQHSGIYLGDGKMLHAGGHAGMRTEITSISKWAEGSGNTLVTYTRILDN
jgi:cell wall-associated NlpC family hydrolase